MARGLSFQGRATLAKVTIAPQPSPPGKRFSRRGGRPLLAGAAWCAIGGVAFSLAIARRSRKVWLMSSPRHPHRWLVLLVLLALLLPAAAARAEVVKLDVHTRTP